MIIALSYNLVIAGVAPTQGGQGMVAIPVTHHRIYFDLEN